jgi:hypothetical protein
MGAAKCLKLSLRNGMSRIHDNADANQQASNLPSKRNGLRNPTYSAIRRRRRKRRQKGRGANSMRIPWDSSGVRVVPCRQRRLFGRINAATFHVAARAWRGLRQQSVCRRAIGTDFS